MRKISNILGMIFAGFCFLISCVPSKKFNTSQSALQSARNDSALLANKVKELQASIAQLNQLSINQKQKIDSQDQQLEQQKKQNGILSQQVSELNLKTEQLLNDAANKQSLLSKSKQELINQQVKLE
jgi:chemotaxis protein MotB